MAIRPVLSAPLWVGALVFLPLLFISVWVSRARRVAEQAPRAPGPDADNARWAQHYEDLAAYAHDTGGHCSAGCYEGLAAKYRRLPPTDSHRVELDMDHLRARLDSLAAQVEKELRGE